MTVKPVLIEKVAGCAVITLNRPQISNAFNSDMRTIITSALCDFEEDAEVGAVLITGAGNSFCSGGDIKELSNVRSETLAGVMHYSDQALDFHMAFRRFPKPVVVAAKGHCLGEGLVMVLLADMAIAAENTTFGTPEVDLGVFPTATICRWMWDNIGAKRAFEYVASAKKFSAVEAERVGLINKVVAVTELDKMAREMAQTLASKSRSAMRLGKPMFYQSLTLPPDQLLDYARLSNLVQMSNLSAAEGLNTFVSKNKPASGER